MDLRQAIADPGADDPSLRCSAKGCPHEAVFAVRWNNPKLHDPARRKVWLACAEHENTLREFLSMRDFYLDTVLVGELDPRDG